MARKVRIKAGPVEFEYEGEAEFGIEDIKDLFTHIETLFKVPALRERSDYSSQEQPKDDLEIQQSNGKERQSLHISTVAAKLDVKSGPDLIIAAAATIQIYQGKDKFTRQEISDLMKQATKYYKGSYSKNIGQNLTSLVGNKINELSSGVYSLTASESKSLELKLDQ